MIVYQQATTGKLHRRRSCSITSRTRYDHFPVEFTDELATSCPRCAKCWDGFTPRKIELPPATTDEAIARSAVRPAGPVQRHAGEPPSSTEAVISGVIRRGDGGSAIRRAIERSARSSS